MADAPLHETILQTLRDTDGFKTSDVAAQIGVDHQTVVGAVKSLQSVGDVIKAEQREEKKWVVTEEGEEVVAHGSHEARVFNALSTEGILQSELMKLPHGKVGFSKAMSNKWVAVDKSVEKGPWVVRTVEKIEDVVREKLQLVKDGKLASLDDKDKNDLRKRKLLTEVVVKTYWVTKGPAFSMQVYKQETDLTAEMIARLQLGVGPTTKHPPTIHPTSLEPTPQRQRS